ncbi:hypothetical protein XM38_027410 [Halomicronema hongdechloris C2206]|uniref:Uncharacterized protein n=1 Tax=Halomicronema hongdechloris C2206 TaxID=1641165 RepID=A0A1Z3HNP5_9CYAN|nr:sigma 54-interacting transcriptional regulator [Halomicronema hongdechloris]ASC71787.1 hypothetical protein XM38_027410 [Halomicronema hongdechloris C2206]
MPIPDIVTWLQERTALNLLSEDILEALAPCLEERSIQAQQRLVVAGEQPDGLYVLHQGRLETDERPGAVSYLPGAVLNLESLLLDQPPDKTVVALTPVRLWYLRADRFRQLLSQYPAILQTFTRQLVNELKQLSFQLDYEQERQAILRPYVVTKAKRGVIGRSRYANRLRSHIREASDNQASVLIFGEPGLEKDNLAALIHFGSARRRDPIIQVDCSKVQASGADLFGRGRGRPGLIEALGQGTLIFNNVQELPEELLPAIVELLQTRRYHPIHRPDDPPASAKTTQARLIVITERVMPQLSAAVDTEIKVPPVRVRKADISDQVDYYISLICRRRGIERLQVAPEAIRKLQAYDFPNNLRELENLVSRAIAQVDPGGVITEEIIWPSQGKKQQLRFNLLNGYPKLRRFLRSPWWPDRINYGFTLAFFALVVAVLFIGPQTRQENVALNLFWAWWWPLVLIGFPFVGRVWCAVCPFMIYGEVTQALRQRLLPQPLKRWPRQRAERWGGWFLFGLFVLILRGGRSGIWRTPPTSRPVCCC